MDKGTTRRFTADLHQLERIRHFIEERAADLRVAPVAVPGMVQAVDEAATNIIVHGYKGRPGEIEIEVGAVGDALVVRLRDQAPPFDPTTLPPPDLDLPLEARPFGGLGVFLMNEFTDEVSHRLTSQGGNELTLLKRAVLPGDIKKEEFDEHHG